MEVIQYKNFSDNRFQGSRSSDIRSDCKNKGICGNNEERKANSGSHSVFDRKPASGKLSEALVFEKDIVSPLGEDVWDACK